MKTDIILAGVGGQGILTIATILGKAALKENLYLKQAEVHGMSQRGGDVQSNLRISSTPIYSDLIPSGSADMIVSLEPMEALRYVPYLSEQGWIVTNSTPFVNIDNYPDIKEICKDLQQHGNLVAFDMDAAARSLMSPRSSNMVLLGAASPFVELEGALIEQAIADLFIRKGEKAVEVNISAYRAGREYTEDLLVSLREK
ncbi:MAG: indolepyruvate oxidoreductase subunit beta [Muribaculaceae bacterium]|nr:indolepyruvate oxidoreductase subunit beta [Muribaculaceae bacterium]